MFVRVFVSVYMCVCVCVCVFSGPSLTSQLLTYSIRMNHTDTPSTRFILDSFDIVPSKQNALALYQRCVCDTHTHLHPSTHIDVRTRPRAHVCYVTHAHTYSQPHTFARTCRRTRARNKCALRALCADSQTKGRTECKQVVAVCVCVCV